MLPTVLAAIQSDFVLRVIAAFVAGAIVGTERESHGRAAGMRTTILVCVAACMAMLISSMLLGDQAATASGTFRADPARLAAGVLTGMGFLGAGAILRNGNRVQGLTTAATLWFVSMIGLAFGAGYFGIGLLGVLVVVLILFVMPHIERLVKNDWYATVTVRVRMDGVTPEEILAEIEAQGVRVKNMELDYDADKQCKTLRYELKLKRDQAIGLSSRIVQALRQHEGIQLVSWS